MKMLAPILALPLFLAPCEDPYPVQGHPVDVKIGCESVICGGADYVTGTIVGPDTTTIDQSCKWVCSTFEGETEQYVYMEFQRPVDGCFVLTYQWVDDGMTCPSDAR